METYKNDSPKDHFSDREKIVYDLYVKLNQKNQHKMMPIPVCEIPKGFL
jgi:NAD+ synthase